MQTPAVGEGPVAFIDDQGKQLSIPLTAIYFENGVVQSKVSAGGLQEWLNYLVLQGQLAPGPTPTADSAMTFTAATAGAMGNDINVEVREIGTDTVEIKVVENHVYEDLTFDSTSDNSVGTVLDSSGGLVWAKEVTATDTDVPASGLVAPTTPGTDTVPATWEIKSPPAAGVSTKLAILEARSLGSEKGSMTIFVDNVDEDAKTFTLKVEWEITSTVVPADLVAADPLPDLKFAVTVDPPIPRGPLHFPRPGQFRLEGGAELVPARPAKKASVTLLADA
jgi:hypothetical protein